MKTIFLKLFALFVLFFGTWFLLRQVDWITIFHVKQLTKTTEEKLGDFIWETQGATENEIKSKRIINKVDSIITRICNANNIDKEQIKLHVVSSKDINAFALPDRHLVVYTQLILDCENSEELSGVLAHEIAHMELNHVMKKITQEIGLSQLLSVTNGKDLKVAKELAKLLSSSSFSRSLEQEADLKACEYLINANINPTGLASFLFRLSTKEPSIQHHLTWVSSHPESVERSTYITEQVKEREKEIHEKTVLTETSWKKLQADVKEENNEQ
ncbi:MAG TPA: M48 family metallopeptidase [Bacteroidia bacterium]|jgi:predicted Zn-dependent protease|nr:M48 family metallopeptidase [Bacteroidia bacterium]HRG53279.1 M48 family metallopeptidase [Bacteroidia bacterium]